MNYLTQKNIIIALVVIISLVIGIKVYSEVTELAERFNTDKSKILGIAGAVVVLFLVGGLSSNSKSS
ncbi:hypothetical protein C900_00230 [Fulvivirga imtechensis AK7]|uniref:Uncharacterized protein n=1 Tax=Fulvivirga imtechensis AK7 TaxID=1237149 RepID=L8JMG3_9BACT|nr:hypothetical protein [Fulvivirga imtechensis]ELR68582.1 hypothetical protein C900_00230 [Fulvivirga imtechensis AK7]